MALIEAARGALQEMWVPAEWAILLAQIAKTTQDALLDGGDTVVSVDAVSEYIRAKIVESAAEGDGETPRLDDVLSEANRNIESWREEPASSQKGILIREQSRRAGGWYGARSVEEIINRVKKRAGALLKIFNTAYANGVQPRFFSVDLARSGAAHGGRRQRGLNGTVTLVNADEAPRALAVTVPAGLPYTYALTRLTVQNRRALSTLLWSDVLMPYGGVLIWSDTDGDWLKDPGQGGFRKLTRTLAACSAPHHASGNTAHDAVWDELRHAPDDLLVVSAGGQWNQSYHKDYTALQARRCCTRCRNVSWNYQEVRLSSSAGGRMVLHQACLGVH
ncbi:hypothetical protein ACFV3I_05565 [Microbacterium sp. NPDC059771]|uniref:hypothetical protein n=1 Tax=Microbacterium sp. NPDC059771 TaxID=3346941 RepID=UPI0036505F41